MERDIFFLGNLFPKYEELVPHYEVNYFFPFFRENLPLSKTFPRYEERIPQIYPLLGKKFPIHRENFCLLPIG